MGNGILENVDQRTQLAGQNRLELLILSVTNSSMA